MSLLCPLQSAHLIARHALDARRTCMVGDRLDTDVAFGRASGMRTLLVEVR